MRASKRIIALLIVLLNSEKPLTVTYIVENVPGYNSTNKISSARQFERDCHLLEEIGIQLKRKAEGTKVLYQIIDNHAHKITTTNTELELIKLLRRDWNDNYHEDWNELELKFKALTVNDDVTDEERTEGLSNLKIGVVAND